MSWQFRGQFVLFTKTHMYCHVIALKTSVKCVTVASIIVNYLYICKIKLNETFYYTCITTWM